MPQKGDKTIVDNGVPHHKRTLEQARSYQDKFKHRSQRLRSFDELEKRFAQRVLAMAGKDARIIDVPCGNGRLYPVFSQAKQLTMIDFDANMLQACKEQFGESDHVTFLQGDMGDLKLPDNSADMCFCMRLFHHVPTDEARLKILRELARVTSKHVALSFYDQHCFRYYQRSLRGKSRSGQYTTAQNMTRLGKQVGLKLVEKLPRINLFEHQRFLIFRKDVG